MPLLENKKTKCPLCGAKNPVDAPRCGICTRPLQSQAALPSQAVYEEALWSTRIASKQARGKINPYAVLAIAVIGAVILNYFVIGLGPSWTHEDSGPERGADWKVYRDQPDYEIDMPGQPMIGTASAQGATLTTATVWVDGNWAKVRDDNTQAAGKLDAARVAAHAALVVGSGNAPADPAASLTAIVQSLLGGLTLEPGGVTVAQNPPAGRQVVTLATNYTGFPEPNDRGVVRATATVANGHLWVVVSYVRGGDDAALHAALTDHFEPKI